MERPRGAGIAIDHSRSEGACERESISRPRAGFPVSLVPYPVSCSNRHNLTILMKIKELSDCARPGNGNQHPRLKVEPARTFAVATANDPSRETKGQPEMENRQAPSSNHPAVVTDRHRSEIDATSYIALGTTGTHFVSRSRFLGPNGAGANCLTCCTPFPWPSREQRGLLQVGV